MAPWSTVIGFRGAYGFCRGAINGALVHGYWTRAHTVFCRGAIHGALPHGYRIPGHINAPLRRHRRFGPCGYWIRATCGFVGAPFMALCPTVIGFRGALIRPLRRHRHPGPRGYRIWAACGFVGVPFMALCPTRLLDSGTPSVAELNRAALLQRPLPAGALLHLLQPAGGGRQIVQAAAHLQRQQRKTHLNISDAKTRAGKKRVLA